MKAFFSGIALLSTVFAIPTVHEGREGPVKPAFDIPPNEINPVYGGVISNTRAPNYKMITGTMTVPEVKLPAGYTDDRFTVVSAYIGLDGFNCPSFLRAGIEMILDTRGRTTYSLTYSMADFFGGVVDDDPEAGDVLRFNVSVGFDVVSNRYDPSRGWVDIENLTKGTVYGRNLSRRSNPLCLNTANWWMQRFDPRSVDSLMAMPDFGKIEWTDTYAETLYGERVDPRESYVLDLDDGYTLTKSEVTENTVTIYYDGLSQ